MRHRKRQVEEFVRRVPLSAVFFSIAGMTALVRVLSDKGEVAGLFLGGSALLYALFQFRDAGATLTGLKQANRGLDGLAGRLDTSVESLTQGIDRTSERLEAQLSTKRLDVFPHFIPAIVSLLEAAERKIVICCDHPSYGVFSDPESYPRYKAIIAKRVVDPKYEVSFLCNNLARRTELRHTQIALQGTWDTWQQDPRMAAFVKKYRTDPGLEAEHLSEKEFIEMLEKIDVAMLDVFESAGAANEPSLETNHVLPLYFWLADERKAVFALAALKKGALEVGFQTEDPGLIAALSGIFTRYRNAPPRDPSAH